MTQRNTSWNAPYTFSGKEKDVETGYGYFGARYYDSGLSIWLSVDPMSDKYPSMSPYNYCANNPVILVDPDGMEIDDTYGSPDDPKGKGNGHAKIQTTKKLAPFTWHTASQDKMNNQSTQQDNTTSQSGSSTSNNKNSQKGRGGFCFIDNNNSIPSDADKTNHDVKTIDVTGPLEIVKSWVSTFLEIHGSDGKNSTDKIPKSELDKPTERNYIEYDIRRYGALEPRLTGRIKHGGTKRDSIEAVKKVRNLIDGPSTYSIR